MRVEYEFMRGPMDGHRAKVIGACVVFAAKRDDGTVSRHVYMRDVLYAVGSNEQRVVYSHHKTEKYDIAASGAD
jgi:hypothetical protein